MSDETERPEDTVRRYARRLGRVDELHQPRQREHFGFLERWCIECRQDWPCPTYLVSSGDADQAFDPIDKANAEIEHLRRQVVAEQDVARELRRHRDALLRDAGADSKVQALVAQLDESVAAAKAAKAAASHAPDGGSASISGGTK